MKALAVAVLALAPACTTTQLATTEAERQQIASLEMELEQAELELTEAKATGDEALILAARQKVDSVASELRAIEEREARERVGGLVGILGSLPIVGPYVAPISPLLLGFAPLLGRRGRRHFKTLVRNLNPFDGDGGSWTDAFGTLMKYLGLSHSSPASEAAAETA